MKNSVSIYRNKQSDSMKYLWILVMLDLTFQLFGTFPVFERHYLFWMIGLCLVGKYSVSYLKSTAFMWMLVYIMIVAVNCITGDQYFDSFNKVFAVEGLNFFFPIVLSYALLKRSDYHLFKCLVIVMGFFLIESTIVTYIVDTIYPGIMRLQSNADSIKNNASLLAPFISLGMSDYELPHALPVIMPGLICLLKSNTIKRIYVWIFIVTTIVLAYASGAFTALSLTLLAFFVSFFINTNNLKKAKMSILFIVLVSIPIVFSTDVQLTMVKTAQSVFPENDIVQSKLEAIKNTIDFGEAEGDVDARKQTYDSTWKAIFESPIWGTNDNEIGGHSAIPDRMAMLGVVGIIPLFLFLYYQIKFTLRYITGYKRYFYYIGLVNAAIILMTKNMSTWSMWLALFTILPGLIWWSEKGKSINYRRP